MAAKKPKGTKPESAEAPKPWQNRIVGHEERDPAELKANDRNWRTHPKSQRDAMGAVLDELGWIQDVIVNQTTGRMLDGHLRVELAIERREPTVPIKLVALSEEEEDRVLATFDPLGEMARSNNAKLTELLDRQKAKAGGLGDLLAAIGKANGIPESKPTAPGTSRGLGEPVVSYQLVFDNEGQRDRFYALLRWLKKHGEGETIASRFDAFLEERWAEGQG